MVYRVYVEKKPGLSPEAESLLGDLRGFLGIESLTGVHVRSTDILVENMNATPAGGVSRVE